MDLRNVQEREARAHRLIRVGVYVALGAFVVIVMIAGTLAWWVLFR